MVIGSNEDVADELLLTFHGDNIEEYYQQDIVTNIELEYIVTSVNRYLFHPRMVGFVNKQELSDKKYQTNGNVIDGKL